MCCGYIIDFAAGIVQGQHLLRRPLGRLQVAGPQVGDGQVAQVDGQFGRLTDPAAKLDAGLHVLDRRLQVTRLAFGGTQVGQGIGLHDLASHLVGEHQTALGSPTGGPVVALVEGNHAQIEGTDRLAANILQFPEDGLGGLERRARASAYCPSQLARNPALISTAP